MRLFHEKFEFSINLSKFQNLFKHILQNIFYKHIKTFYYSIKHISQNYKNLLLFYKTSFLKIYTPKHLLENNIYNIYFKGGFFDLEYKTLSKLKLYSK